MIIELTKGYKALVSELDYAKVSEHRWQIHSSGYAVRGQRVNGRMTMVYMHREIMNAPEGVQVDHIDHNKLDNRRENLRLVSTKENAANRRVRNDSKSGVKGVRLNPRTRRFEAKIYINGKAQGLGSYLTLDEAGKAFAEAHKRLYGGM